jgi:hypothetical protein
VPLSSCLMHSVHSSAGYPPCHGAGLCHNRDRSYRFAGEVSITEPTGRPMALEALTAPCDPTSKIQRSHYYLIQHGCLKSDRCSKRNLGPACPQYNISLFEQGEVGPGEVHARLALGLPTLRLASLANLFSRLSPLQTVESYGRFVAWG